MWRIGIFEQPFAAMPISDYANAFFFARRKRVTLKGARAIGFAILKKRAPKNRQHFLSAIANCVRPDRCTKPVETRSRNNFARRWRLQKGKSPALPGFLTIFFFVQI